MFQGTLGQEAFNHPGEKMPLRFLWDSTHIPTSPSGPVQPYRMLLPNVGGEEEGVGVLDRNLHPGDQEMRTPGSCSPASGSRPGKKPWLLPPRMQPPGLEPRALPRHGAGTSTSLLARETLRNCLFKAWVPRPGLAAPSAA